MKEVIVISLPVCSVYDYLLNLVVLVMSRLRKILEIKVDIYVELIMDNMIGMKCHRIGCEEAVR